MQSRQQAYRVMGALIFAWFTLASVGGCAEGRVPIQDGVDGGGQPCTSKLDCASNQICGPDDVCILPQPEGDMGATDMPVADDAGATDMRPPDDGGATTSDTGGGGGDMGGGGGDDMGGGGDDMGGGGGCMPSCTDPQVCIGGNCVDPCPDCEAPGTCTQTGCVYPSCASVGDACDPSTFEQGDFYCMPLSSNKGRCRSKCDDPGYPDGCGASRFCLNVGINMMSYSMCLESECSADMDFPAGETCRNYENGFGLCVTPGNRAIGQSCTPSTSLDSDPCEKGSICSPDTNTCLQLCDPWAGNPGCSAGSYCVVGPTSREGFCRSNTVNNAPLSAYAVCSTSGAVCSDATRCFSSGRCLKYCRPGQGDCAGVTSGGLSTICSATSINSVTSLGLCRPSCNDPSVSCQNGFFCESQTGFCRKLCEAATEVADCCGGDADGCFETCEIEPMQTVGQCTCDPCQP